MGESQVMAGTRHPEERELVVAEAEVNTVALGSEPDTDGASEGEGAGGGGAEEDIKWQGGPNQPPGGGSGGGSGGDSGDGS